MTRSAPGGDPGGRQDEHVDAVGAEDGGEVLRRMLHRRVTLDLLIELLQRRDVGGEIGRQRGLPGSETLGCVDLGDGRVERVDAVGDVPGGALDLMPPRVAGAAAGRRCSPARVRGRGGARAVAEPMMAADAREMVQRRVRCMGAVDIRAPLFLCPHPGILWGHGERSG